MRKGSFIAEMRRRRDEPISLAFEPGLDTYGGRNSVELRVKDLQWPADPS